jgi:RHS repeat-associated core domain
VYWYHPDHLGSSSFITGIDGEVNQNIEYFPSGEVFLENHLNSYNTPYKFNSKELDDETGYYYYGARYYNPRVSLWLNVDPAFEDYPNWSPYAYSFNSPVKFIDPDGMSPVDPGDPRSVQIIMYTIFRNDKGYYYSRNSQNDYVTTRIEGKNWKGSQEQHFYNPYNGTTYNSPADFQKAFPKAKFVDESLKDKLSRSADATATVAKIAWESEESRAVLLMPVAVIEDIVLLRYAAPILRSRYIEEVGSLELYGKRMLSAGHTEEEVARGLHGLRRSIGEKYKAITPPEMLEKIYQRNIEKYGDKLGPSIDYLRKQGKSWKDIIESSARAGGKDLGLKGSKK